MTVQQAPTTNNQLWDRLAGGPGKLVVEFCDDEATLATLTRVCSAWHSQSLVTKAVAEREKKIELSFHPNMIAFFNKLNIKIEKLPLSEAGQPYAPALVYPIVRHRLLQRFFIAGNLFIIKAYLENRISGESDGDITFMMQEAELSCLYRKSGKVTSDERDEDVANYLTPDEVETILSGQHGTLRLGRGQQLNNASNASFLAAVITATAFGLNWLLQGY